MPEVFLCAEKVRSAAIVFCLYMFPNWRAALDVKEGLQPISFDTYQARVSQTGDRSLWMLIWTFCLWCCVQTSVAQRAGGGRGVGLHLRTGTVPADRAEGSRCESTSPGFLIHIPLIPLCCQLCLHPQLQAQVFLS